MAEWLDFRFNTPLFSFDTTLFPRQSIAIVHILVPNSA